VRQGAQTRASRNTKEDITTNWIKEEGRRGGSIDGFKMSSFGD